jgi:branched-chain amino acid transport system substrate-binding protein
VLVSSAGTTALSEDQCSPYTVQWTYTTYALARGTASAVVKTGPRAGSSWRPTTPSASSWRPTRKAWSRPGGGKVLGTIYHPLNTADFSSFLLQAQSSGADVIALANAGGDTINAIKQAGEFGIGTGKQNWPPCCSCSPTCTAWA